MQNLIVSAQRILPVLFLALLTPTLTNAQTGDPMFDRMEQMMRRMQEQMRRGMSFDTTFEGGHLQFSPDSNSYFYYRIDTSFNGMGDNFFEFSPFGSPGDQDGFMDLGQLFDQFFNGVPPQGFRPGPDNFPSDDGQAPGGDDLLPEERLRLQEENRKPEGKPAKPVKPEKSKVKTIRI